VCCPMMVAEQVCWCASTTEANKVVYLFGGMLLDSVLILRD